MIDNETIYTAMQSGAPRCSFQKTILGKVYVSVLDSFTDQPTGKLLEGDPRKFVESSIYDAWSTRQEVFFRNMNRNHFNNGILKEFVRSTTPRERTIEESTDPELLEFVNLKFLALQAKLNKIESAPVLFRLINIARDNEKSDKIIKAIEARISEIQSSGGSEE